MRFVKFSLADLNGGVFTIILRSFSSLYSSERGSWKSADANLYRRRGHPTKSHRRIYLIVLLRRDVLAHKVGARSMVVCKSSRALHGATGALGFWKIVLR